MTRAFSWFVALFGLTCIGIALLHVAFGPSVIPGSVPVNPTMDSEDRFYATLFLGFGAALVWCSRQPAARGGPLKSLLLLFFLGGCARAVSALIVGPPNLFFRILWALELLLPPLLWFCWHRLFASGRSGAEDR